MSISGKCSTSRNIQKCCAKQEDSLITRGAQVTMSWCSSGRPFSSYFGRYSNPSNSCGMDACEHEFESMSRHNRKVPTSFYYRFARDACVVSDEYAKGRTVSVLEGGYSDRALTSGAMAHLSGLVDVPSSLKVDEEWWSIENLIKVGTSLSSSFNLA